MRFLNASVLERKSLNRNLSWGFPLGNLLPKTRVLKHRVWERKRRPNANASVLGTLRFRTLRSPGKTDFFKELRCKPERLGEGSKIGKFPKVVRRGCTRSFEPRERKTSCTGAAWGCTGAKQGRTWCKRLLGDFLRRGFKRPFAPSPYRLAGIFLFSTPLPGALVCKNCDMNNRHL